ncbi:tRNA cyclic N6-threonylcarbamoyladenosine(37) synthase TcdA [Candidatus Erwinia haradaeae]|uniref:tRNA threonylcarbamoyladenosine dehydratase n=1 Tax=Candidatus Erwinia haradaeae TaxID=1922217 RepID=A0A451D1I9_9GAMM|nr:tRNA cyclic N6-threonylcarbamoyladenosine(37) synthase TcdA [Candidatus Erwinia haradaeae]VFP79470.1 tRNA threonylcarbamoyladenosine dehydratase [Candidatus Erwinia haradaeae]
MQMLSSSWQKRFSGISRVYGKHSLPLFAKKHICIVGIGGVGSWAAEALTRSGIGNLTLIDMDDICVTNTNRQIHTLQTNIGRSKNKTMSERIKNINPECHITCIDDFLTTTNISTFINHNFSYVIDAIDNAAIKAELVSWCYYNHIPLITIGGAGGKINPTKIQISDLSKTIQDPLCAALRKRLKDKFKIMKNTNGNLKIDCVFSTEPILYQQKDGSVSTLRNKNYKIQRLDCEKGLGSVSMVTATFGFIAVSHILHTILEKST